MSQQPSSDPDPATRNAETGVVVPEFAARADVFGHYRIERELGRGGMGIVYLAHDEQLDLPVALKVLPTAVARGSDAIRDLKKEVLRGFALNHEGIVRIHGFETDASGAAVVMEYIDGHTLADARNEQPGECFDADALLPWLRQLCAALDYAHHTARIAHRDLKPRNVMVDKRDRIKIADFGIASSLSESVSRVSVRAGSSGTPPYMSPQQVRGVASTHLDDIYSLGALIFDLLTGKPPFYRGGPAAVMHQVIGEAPVTMQTRRAELNVTGKQPIPPHWEEAIAACLAKEPEARPQSAGELLARLESPEATVPLPTVAAPPAPIPQPPAPPIPPIPSPAHPPRNSGVLRAVLIAAICAGLLLGLAAIGAWLALSDRGNDTAQRQSTPPSADAVPSEAEEAQRARHALEAEKARIAAESERVRKDQATVETQKLELLKRQQMAAERAQEEELARQAAAAQSRRDAAQPWLFPDSDRRLLQRSELARLSRQQLWQARNEIYARRGLIFSSAAGQSYVKSLGNFYRGTDRDQDRVYQRMNRFEQANVELLKGLEQRR